MPDLALSIKKVLSLCMLHQMYIGLVLDESSDISRSLSYPHLSLKKQSALTLTAFSESNWVKGLDYCKPSKPIYYIWEEMQIL